MAILSWLLFGLIAGAVAGYIMKSNFGIIGNIIVGIIGSFIGGFVSNLLFHYDAVNGWHVESFIFAVIGSIILIALLRAFSGSRARI